MELSPFSSPVGVRVLVAFDGDASRWRSLGGIAREAHLTTREVAEFIETHEDCFVQSRVKPGGTPLYGIRDGLGLHAS